MDQKDIDKNTAGNKDKERPSSSTLLAGTGLITTSKCNEKIDLRLSRKDMTQIAKNSTLNKHEFNVTIEGDKVSTSRLKTSCRASPIHLPKTYVTRSGSLLLFSESRIRFTPEIQRPRSSVNQSGFMASRTPVTVSFPLERKLLPEKYKKEKLSEWKRSSLSSARRDHQNIRDRASMLVSALGVPSGLENSLSNALTTYTVISRPQSHTDRYQSAVRQAWKEKSCSLKYSSNCQNSSKVSAWTREWIQEQETVTIDMPTPRLSGRKRAETSYHTDRLKLQEARASLALVDRVPVNTPLRGLREKTVT